jgi:aspartate/methionine/tyrosine aminotransferase
MISEADRLNDDLAAASPALAALLSPLGRRAAFARGIPFQSAEARGKRFNGTIGQITDGRGGALALPSLAAQLAGLGDGGDLDRAVLYSPIDGLPELRRRWRERQRRDAPAGIDSTLPLVTTGLTHGLSLVADLFAGEGRAVAVAEPFWGNYRGVFATRTGARLVTAPAYRDRRPDARAVARAVATLPDGEPAIALINFPSNPGGWSPGAAEREELVRALVAEAEQRPLLAVCDDAYAGLVYDEAVPAASLFWQLAGRHPNLVPVKVDGATKELAFFGGRVGFLTFALPPESPAAAALESKVKGLLRATVGSPVATSQVVALRALASPTVEGEIEALRRLLAERWRAITAALAACDPALLVALPSNSGSFVLVELTAPGVDPEALRRHLLERHDTGVVAIAPNFLRIAHCSVDTADLPELVRRVERGAAELAGRASA